MLCLVNEQRALAQQSDGIFRPRLTPNPKLRTAARGHAEAAAKIQWWPATGGPIVHVNPETGSHPADRITAAGYCPAEGHSPRNEVAYDAWYTGPVNPNTAPFAAVVGYPGQEFSWVISPEHQKIILDPTYEEAGVAVVKGIAEKTDHDGNPIHADGGVIVVMDVGSCELLELSGLGHAWAWGDNGLGQLGDATTTERHVPVEVKDPLEQPALGAVADICAGAGHNLVLKPDGTVWAWGYNGKGQLGNGTTAGDSRPHRVHVLSGIVGVAAGYNHSLAVRRDGRVWAWGDNQYAQVGKGWPAATQQNVPVQLLFGADRIVSVAAGVRHSLALTQFGRVLAWGNNEGGVLGSQMVYDHDTSSPDPLAYYHKDPVTVEIEPVVAVAAGHTHSLAIHSDGTVWAWGLNNFGMLGTGDTDWRASPVELGGLSRMVAVAGGASHSLALSEGGRVWAWGNNDNGQLGNGTTAGHLTPEPVPSLTRVVSLAAGLEHSVVLKEDGSVWAWGRNLNGALGDGTTDDSNVPVQVAHSTPWTAVAAGMWHSVGLAAD